MYSVKMLGRQIGLLLVLAMPFAAVAQTTAVTPNAASTPAQAQQTTDGKFIQELGDKAIAVVADKSLAKDQRDAQYRDLLTQAFDLQTIGHFVLGYAWQTSGPAQINDYMNLFKTIVVTSYGNKLNLYAGEKFVVKAVRQENDRDSIVNSVITHADNSPPLAVDWRVRDEDGKPMIIDVTVAGVSQSVTTRSEYAAILQQNNGNMDALLDAMRQQVRNLSASGSGQNG